MEINQLWHNGTESDWKAELDKYYSHPFVRNNIDLENRMERLVPSDIDRMSSNEFYLFLRDEYFVWKFTAKNRLATARKALAKYEKEGMGSLAKIQRKIMFAYENDPDNTEELLEVAKRIHGLGTSGASGLLSIMFPEHYGTIDQFSISALLEVDNLPEHNALMRMNPQNLTVKDGVILENTLRKKAKELNRKFESTEWTPRRIDMVLWATDR